MLNACDIRRFCIDAFNEALYDGIAIDLTLRVVAKKKILVIIYS